MPGWIFRTVVSLLKDLHSHFIHRMIWLMEVSVEQALSSFFNGWSMTINSRFKWHYSFMYINKTTMNTTYSIDYICGATSKSVITNSLVFFTSQITFKRLIINVILRQFDFCREFNNIDQKLCANLWALKMVFLPSILFTTFVGGNPKELIVSHLICYLFMCRHLFSALLFMPIGFLSDFSETCCFILHMTLTNCSVTCKPLGNVLGFYDKFKSVLRWTMKSVLRWTMKSQ